MGWGLWPQVPVHTHGRWRSYAISHFARRTVPRKHVRTFVLLYRKDILDLKLYLEKLFFLV